MKYKFFLDNVDVKIKVKLNLFSKWQTMKESAYHSELGKVYHPDIVIETIEGLIQRLLWLEA